MQPTADAAADLSVMPHYDLRSRTRGGLVRHGSQRCIVFFRSAYTVEISMVTAVGSMATEPRFDAICPITFLGRTSKKNCPLRVGSRHRTALETIQVGDRLRSE